ncbi:O-antigen ligase [Silvibacterium bohemicum]|uniref:O-antigen ligase n=1 Tax=Silvibacterium bohemicum TaxID=1577686 RepID=A0A841K3R7_9BACT|nr:O-antigen ligase [Silvibacterium bohemicum]MBB6144894.1 O-antigen ligase [Silvibacterium bohemicum]
MQDIRPGNAGTPRIGRSSLAIEDCVCAIILAFFAVQGAVPFIAPHQALEVNNSPASGVTFWGGIASQVLVYATICFFLCANWRRVVHWFPATRWTAVFGCLAIISSVWSQFPLYTLRRSIPFLFAGLFGLFFAVRFPVRRQLSILFMAMLAVALGTILLAVLVPRIGLDATFGHSADWQGVFTSKNACGRMMVLATAITLSQSEGTGRKVLSLALFIFVLVMSGSRGAWAIEAAVFASYVAIKVLGLMDSRSRVLLLLGSLIAITTAAVAGAMHLSALSQLVGRDATLTGRTQIWKQVWPFILERPILGWGYAGFWRGIQGESFRVAAAMRFVIFHAHNGFLEIWLELGAVGLFIFGCSYLRAWRKLWPRLRSGRIERVSWMFFVLALVALYDLDENSLLIDNGLFWVIYVATLVDIELLEVEEQLIENLSTLLSNTGALQNTHSSTIDRVWA